MDHSGFERTIIGNAINAFRDDMIHGNLTQEQAKAHTQLYYLYEFLETTRNIEVAERENWWKAIQRLTDRLKSIEDEYGATDKDED